MILLGLFCYLFFNQVVKLVVIYLSLACELPVSFGKNTHCECVFFDHTQQQGASKLQARKPPKKIHNESVCLAKMFSSVFLFFVLFF